MAAVTNLRAGTVYLKIDGALQEAKGTFTYNLGNPQRTTIPGADGVHGYYTTHQAAFIEGAITDSVSLDLNVLTSLDGVDITLELANGKSIVLENAWYAGEGSVTTEQGEIGVRFESRSKAQEIS